MPTPAKPAIIDRSDPIFGVCEALGDDFGINANWFRAALAPLMLWQPLWTVVGYFLLGAVVLATRLIFPDVREPMPAAAAPIVESEPVAEELRLAA
jgi:phage shock protein PspC (stress-responsive transcriptional regulator)